MTWCPACELPSSLRQPLIGNSETKGHWQRHKLGVVLVSQLPTLNPAAKLVGNCETPHWSTSGKKMPGRPNILLIMSDMQRSDALGCYGNVFVQTPNIDTLADGGTRFTTCFTPFPLCTPARATLWTGVYPHTHKVIGNVYGVDNAFARFAGSSTLVFDRLKDAGYTTAYFGKWHLGEKNPGCFDVWSAHNSLGGHWVDGRQAMQGGTYLADRETDEGIAFLRARMEARTPFAMVQSYYPPHGPYTVPQAFHKMYRGKGIPYPGYYAACSAIDANVGRLCGALAEFGLAEDTVVIYLSDHGTTFESRDGLYHARVCYDESVRVPLIVRLPDGRGAGRTVEAFVGLQDVTPTLLDLCGLQVPGELQGRSLVPWIVGECPGWRDCFYLESTVSPHIKTVSFVTKDMRVIGPLTQRAIRTETWKLVLSEGGPHELYDLVEDPDEILNLFAVPYEDEHDQYRHFAPHDGIVYRLAARLEAEAHGLGDDVGVALARSVLDHPVVRHNWELNTARRMS
jgi:choline-sulfatase